MLTQADIKTFKISRKVKLVNEIIVINIIIWPC